MAMLDPGQKINKADISVTTPQPFIAGLVKTEGDVLKKRSLLDLKAKVTLDAAVAQKLLIQKGIAPTHRVGNEEGGNSPFVSSNEPKGKVRATPYGSGLKNVPAAPGWHAARTQPKIHFPPDGFDHIHGPSVIDSIDNFNKCKILNLDTNCKAQDGVPDDEDALEAYRTALDPLMLQKSMGEIDGNEYGSCRTPLDAPVGSLKEKWRLLPYFLQLRSLMRQHIDSFDYFVNVDMRMIVQVSLKIFPLFVYLTKEFKIQTFDLASSFHRSHHLPERLGPIMTRNSICSTLIAGWENQKLKKMHMLRLKQPRFNVDCVTVPTPLRSTSTFGTREVGKLLSKKR